MRGGRASLSRAAPKNNQSANSLSLSLSLSPRELESDARSPRLVEIQDSRRERHTQSRTRGDAARRVADRRVGVVELLRQRHACATSKGRAAAAVVSFVQTRGVAAYTQRHAGNHDERKSSRHNSSARAARESNTPPLNTWFERCATRLANHTWAHRTWLPGACTCS